MHNIGKLTSAQRLAVLNGRSTKDIPGLTLGQRLRINRHREREEHSEQKPEPQTEAGADVEQQVGAGGIAVGGWSANPVAPEGQDQEAEAEHGVAAPAKKRRAPRKKG